MTKDLKAITKRNYQILEGYRFSYDDIWDIIVISSFFSMSNKLAN